MNTRIIFMCLFLSLIPNNVVQAGICEGKTGIPGTFERTIVSDDWGRTYLLHVPTLYEGNAPVPLILNFHGLGHSGEYQADYTDMSSKADVENFIVIYPDGLAMSWNADGCCPPAMLYDIDDVGFALDLVDAISEEYCIDPDRIYATGSSNGGMLSHRLACEASNVFAAIGVASASITTSACNPPRPVPVIQTQGTVDPIVPYWTAKASNDYWASHNRCGDSEVVYQKGGALCTAYQDCAEDATVEFCEVSGMGHTWPNDEGAFDWIDATDLFWEFFTQHAMTY